MNTSNSTLHTGEPITKNIRNMRDIDVPCPHYWDRYDMHEDTSHEIYTYRRIIEAIEPPLDSKEAALDAIIKLAELPAQDGSLETYDTAFEAWIWDKAIAAGLVTRECAIEQYNKYARPDDVMVGHIFEGYGGRN